jgi:hypothetical protein
MSHNCHAEGCDIAVPPKMFMCKGHWFQLPPELRNQVWATYRPGQERDKMPSAAYVRATNAAKLYIAEIEFTEESVASLRQRYAETEATFDRMEKESWPR